MDIHALKEALFNKVLEQGLFSCGREAIALELRDSGGLGQNCDLCFSDLITDNYFCLVVECAIPGFKPFPCDLFICYTQDECETNQLVQQYQESVQT